MEIPHCHIRGLNEKDEVAFRELKGLVDGLEVTFQVDGAKKVSGHLYLENSQLTYFDNEHSFSLDFDNDLRSMAQKRFSKQDALVKALGQVAFSPEGIIDGTFGLGQDALCLTSLGIKVVACEKNPISYLLALDALRRLRLRSPLAAEKIQLHFMDVRQLVEKFPAIQVIYLDPMFENENKRLPKKGMQFIQMLESDQENQRYELLDWATQLRGKRVVVKSPSSEKLEKHYPKFNAQFKGKAIHFFVFLQ